MSADVAPRALRERDELASLALPAIGQQVVTALLFVADRALVGRLGPTALASLHAATTITWTAMSLLSAVAIGAMAAVGRRSGARENEGAVVKHALVLAVVLAVVVVVPLWVGRATLAAALAPPDRAVVDLAVEYLEIVLCAVPFAAVSAAASACLQARGDARTPFAAGAAAALVNLVLSAALVRVFGVRGAAMGTAVALILQCAWLGIALRGHWCAAQRAPRSGMGRATAAAFAEKIIFHAGYLVYAAMIAALGSSAAAANQAVLGLEALGYPIAEGLAVCAAVVVARKLGAGRAREAQRAATTAALVAAFSLSGFAVVLLLAPDVSLHLFTSDVGVAAAGRSSLYVAALAQPFMAFAIVSMAALRGAGRGLTALSITLGSAVGIRLGATWLFGFALGMGLTGAWVASGIDWLVQALVAAFVLHRRRRHSKLDAEDVGFLRNRNRACS